MLYHFYVSDRGAPVTGLVSGTDLAWESLRTGENGTDKSASGPAFVEIGGGWYAFDIAYGAVPWDVTGEDLAGVIDCDAAAAQGLADVDRYKPVLITVRGLALALLAHKGAQDKATGHITIYAADGVTPEAVMTMSDEAAALTRAPSGAASE